MDFNCRSNKGLMEGVIDGIPIVIGYLPIAFAFGILAKTTEITLMESILLSAFVFAGASQFMALNLLCLGTSVGEIIFTTMLVNLRHILMSASFAVRMSENARKYKSIIAFGITDEAFSILSFKEGDMGAKYIIALETTGYLSWVVGTGIGYIIGGFLPIVVKDSMGIALYAMFVALLLPEAKKSIEIGILAILSGVVNSICYSMIGISKGWSIVISIIAISLLGLFIFKDEDVINNA